LCAAAVVALLVGCSNATQPQTAPSKITTVISGGTPPPVDPKSLVVIRGTIPDVSGLSETDARKLLAEAGYKRVIVKALTPGAVNPRVAGTLPLPHVAHDPKNTTVELITH
jgi:beta-lactam-binding protein with PASTA domain